jgi:hypothetical protein
MLVTNLRKVTESSPYTRLVLTPLDQSQSLRKVEYHYLNLAKGIREIEVLVHNLRKGLE